MSYCTGKNIEKSRGKVMRILVIEKKPVGIGGRSFGVHRSAILEMVLKIVSSGQPYRVRKLYKGKYLGTSAYEYELHKWSMSLLSAAPKGHRILSDGLIQLALDVRGQLKRRAKEIWHHIKFTLCIKIGLSSARRISKRYDRTKKLKNHKDGRYKGISRLRMLAPEDLAEIDTIPLTLVNR